MGSTGMCASFVEANDPFPSVVSNYSSNTSFANSIYNRAISVKLKEPSARKFPADVNLDFSGLLILALCYNKLVFSRPREDLLEIGSVLVIVKDIVVPTQPKSPETIRQDDIPRKQIVERFGTKETPNILPIGEV